MRSRTIKRFGVAAGIFIGLVGVAILVSYRYMLRVAMEIADRDPTTARHTSGPVTGSDVVMVALVIIFAIFSIVVARKLVPSDASRCADADGLR